MKRRPAGSTSTDPAFPYPTLVQPVAADRLKDGYGVESACEQVQVATARWIKCADAKKLEEFREKNAMNLAIDGAGELVYLAPTRVNLQLAQERAPGVEFMATREQAHVVAAR